MKTLYVLRHAKAEMGEADTQDIDRALAARGCENASALGEWLNQQDNQPDIILSSSSTRTRETTQHLNESMQNPIPATYTESLYLASVGELISEIQTIDDSHNSAMVIGHNPGLHQLCLTLAVDGPELMMSELAMKFPTCALAILELDCDTWKNIAPACGNLGLYLNRFDVIDKLD